jgi:hypothetical protein
MAICDLRFSDQEIFAMTVIPLRASFSAVLRQLCVWVLLCCAGSVWAQTEFYGHKFDNAITLDTQTLQLNGVGGRSVPVIFMRVFAAALYLPQAAHDADSAIDMAGIKRIQIRMNYGVAGKEFKKALVRGIEKNHSPEQQAAFAPRTQAFGRIIDGLGKVKSGDVIDLDFLPAKGLVVSMNGQAKGDPIAGADFYAAVMRIFIGNRPAEKEMKERMLGVKK